MRTLRFIKAYFLLSALLLWQCVFAEVVTERQARQRAADFFAAAEVKTKVSATRPDDFKLVGTFPEVSTKASPTSAPAMYIFDRPAGGYAIVSGDDVARPVLGYSLSGQFPITDMPDNLRGLLQWYADIIDFARQQHWAPSPMAAADGLDPANSVHLKTATWDQHSPFNDLVAEINGQKPPIGCVATAIAIAMRYHKWPKKGTGTLPSYDYRKYGVKYHIEGFDLGHVYDWDKMPEIYQEHYSEEEAVQIARLLYDVAVMCRMEFYPGGSGASLKLSVQRLPDHFGYDRQIHFIDRSNGYTDSQWERFIVDEINADRPVLYNGWGSLGGHAFVIDGYNGRYFSINYGWGGSSDYYTVTPIENHENDLLMFYDEQGMVNGMMPDQGGAPVPVIYAEGESFLPYDFAVGKEFTLSFHVRNSSPGTFTSDFRYALFDRDDNVKEVISSSINVEIDVVEWISRSCRITKPLADGDKILLTMKDPNSGEWSPVIQPYMTIIGFTDRPLSELIEIGYGEEPEYIDGRPNIERDFYLKANRDIWWGIYDSSNNELLINKHLLYGHDWSDSDSRISWHIKDYGGNGITQSDTHLYDIWVPTGNYILRVRNPLTNEQMNINLEL